MKVANDVYTLVEAVKALETSSATWDTDYFIRCLKAYEKGTLERVDSSHLCTVASPNNCYDGLTGILVQDSEDTVLLEFDLSESSGGTQRVRFKQDQICYVLTDVEERIVKQLKVLVGQGHQIELYGRLLRKNDTELDIQKAFLRAVKMYGREIDTYISGLTDEDKHDQLGGLSLDYFSGKKIFFDFTVSGDDQFVSISPEVVYEDGVFKVYWCLYNHTSQPSLGLYESDDFLEKFYQLLVRLEVTTF